MFSAQLPLNSEERELVTKVVAGCTKMVYRYYGPEYQWPNLVRRILTPSQDHLVQLLVYGVSGSLEFFSPMDIESLYSKRCGPVHHSTVSRSLSKLAKVGFLKPYEDQKGPGKHSKNDIEKRRGPVRNYTLSENESALRSFVCKPGPRGRIYGHLYESDVLMELLKFYNFSAILRCKYSDVDQVIKSRKANGAMTEEMVAKFKSQYLRNQNFILQKSDKEIIEMATRYAKFDLSKRNWETDPIYTNFFVAGGQVYSIIEESNL